MHINLPGEHVARLTEQLLEGRRAAVGFAGQHNAIRDAEGFACATSSKQQNCPFFLDDALFFRSQPKWWHPCALSQISDVAARNLV